MWVTCTDVIIRDTLPNTDSFASFYCSNALTDTLEILLHFHFAAFFKQKRVTAFSLFHLASFFFSSCSPWPTPFSIHHTVYRLASTFWPVLSSLTAWVRSSVSWVFSSWTWLWISGSDVRGFSRSRTRVTNSATCGEEVGWVLGRAMSIMKI